MSTHKPIPCSPQQLCISRSSYGAEPVSPSLEYVGVSCITDDWFFITTANLVLQDTIERIFVADLYADIPRGIYLVRGENVLMLGEIVCFSLRLYLAHAIRVLICIALPSPSQTNPDLPSTKLIIEYADLAPLALKRISTRTTISPNLSSKRLRVKCTN